MLFAYFVFSFVGESIEMLDIPELRFESEDVEDVDTSEELVGKSSPTSGIDEDMDDVGEEVNEGEEEEEGEMEGEEVEVEVVEDSELQDEVEISAGDLEEGVDEAEQGVAGEENQNLEEEPDEDEDNQEEEDAEGVRASSEVKDEEEEEEEEGKGEEDVIDDTEADVEPEVAELELEAFESDEDEAPEEESAETLTKTEEEATDDVAQEEEDIDISMGMEGDEVDEGEHVTVAQGERELDNEDSELDEDNNDDGDVEQGQQAQIEIAAILAKEGKEPQTRRSVSQEQLTLQVDDGSDELDLIPRRSVSVSVTVRSSVEAADRVVPVTVESQLSHEGADDAEGEEEFQEAETEETEDRGAKEQNVEEVQMDLSEDTEIHHIAEPTSNKQDISSLPTPPTKSPAPIVRRSPSSRRNKKPIIPYPPDNTPLSPPKPPPAPIIIQLTPSKSNALDVDDYHFVDAAPLPEVPVELPSAITQRLKKAMSYAVPPAAELPVEFNKKGKPGKSKRRDKERERSGSTDGGKKDDWTPMGMVRWTALLSANPVHKRMSRASKCLNTRDWNVSFIHMITLLKLLRCVRIVANCQIDGDDGGEVDSCI